MSSFENATKTKQNQNLSLNICKDLDASGQKLNMAAFISTKHKNHFNKPDLIKNCNQIESAGVCNLRPCFSDTALAIILHACRCHV